MAWRREMMVGMENCVYEVKKKDKNKKIMRSSATNKNCHRRRQLHCQHSSWCMMHFHLLFWCIHTFYPHSISVSISSRSGRLNALLLLLMLLPFSLLANNLRIFQQNHHHPTRCYHSYTYVCI